MDLEKFKAAWTTWQGPLSQHQQKRAGETAGGASDQSAGHWIGARTRVAVPTLEASRLFVTLVPGDPDTPF